MSDWSKPQEVDDATLAFPARVTGSLLPSRHEIPGDFTRAINPWHDLVTHWFFRGLNGASFTPKEGVDRNTALRHALACLGSFEPKHEDKTAGVAWLLSLWFEEVRYDGKVCPPAAPTAKRGDA